MVSIRATVINTTAQPARVYVPDLTGLTIRRAGILLHDIGLSLSASGSGLAVSQNPAPGTMATRGSQVTVEFSPPR